MNLRLKISPEELVVLNVLLKRFLSDNLNNALIQKYIGNIQKNISQKHKDYKGILNEDFRELEHEISKIFFSLTVSENLKQESKKNTQCNTDAKAGACSKCHFYNNGCQKENELRNYWGFDDNEFLSYFNARQNEVLDCIVFEHKATYTILEFKKPHFLLEIHENNETSRHQFSTRHLRLLIHKYGKDAFSNLNDFKEQLA